MKKLEDIPRKSIFEVPDGYFDQLPARVQARIAAGNRSRSTSWSWRGSIRYALPVFLVGILLAGWWLNKAPDDAEAILASIDTEQLAAYLEENNLVTEELIPYEDLTTEDAEAIENEVYESSFDDRALDLLLDELSVDMGD